MHTNDHEKRIMEAERKRVLLDLRDRAACLGAAILAARAVKVIGDPKRHEKA